MTKTIVFIDSRVIDIDTLISDFEVGTEFHIIDSIHDGVLQIEAVLKEKSNYSSIQIISHGSPGTITIGSTILDASTIGSYASELAQIGHALTDTGDILIYGCNVADGDQGQQFIETLSLMTGADVAASNNPTGGTAAGGDWILEVQSGVVDQAATVETLNYSYVLANSIPTVSGPLATMISEGDSSVSMNLLANAHDADLSDNLSIANVFFLVDGVFSAIPAGITINSNTLTFNSCDSAYDVIAQGEQKTIVATYRVLDMAPEVEASFNTKVDYATGYGPSSVTNADVNGDGKFDLIVANVSSDTVSVLMNNGDGAFAPKVDYEAGDSAYSVTSADMNADGKFDLIVANLNGGMVSVLMNNGDGTFAPKVDYRAGTGPRSVTSADVNGDGKSDLIVANRESNTLSVLMNNGDGELAPKVDCATGIYPDSVTSADVNGDGKSDLIVVNWLSKTLSVLTNNGDGTFAPKVDFATGTAPESITSADVNGDGTSDLIVANQGGMVSVLMNNGDGTFATKVDYATGSNPISVTSADVNGDGKSDLIVANRSSNTLSVLTNNGDGTFAPKVDFATGTAPESVTSADVNGDGKSDLIVANRSSNTVSVLINNSTSFGAYPTTTETITITGTNDAPVVTNSAASRQGLVTKASGFSIASGTLKAGDVDSGATLSWSIADEMPACIYGNIEINTITGVWTYTLENANAATEALQEGETVTQSYIARVSDEFGAYADQTITVTIHGTSDSSANSIPTVSGPLSTTVAEGEPSVSLNLLANALDADLTDTLYVGTVSYTVNGVQSALPSGITLNGNTLTVDPTDHAFDAMAHSEQKMIVASYRVFDFAPEEETSFAVHVDYTTGDTPSSVTITDVNGDGKSDLIVTNWDSRTVSVLKNNGDGTFAPKVDYATGSSPGSVTSADVNGDGKSDLIVANWSSNTVSVLKNNGDGTFAPKVDYATGSSPGSVTSADVNGDGKSDLIVANHYSDTVSVMINNGNGSFGTKVDYTTGDGPNTAETADVNGDGKFDLIVDNFSGTVSVMINNGNGTFGAKVDYATGSNPISVTSADVTGDSMPDLIVIHYWGDTVSVLRNNGDGTFAAKVDYATGDFPISVTSADVNGDGSSDLIVANSGSDTVSVLKNRGDGAFTAKVDLSTGFVPSSVTSADVNGDGKSDLIVANKRSNTVSVLFNNSINTIDYPTTTETITINGTNDAPVITNTVAARQGSVTEAGYLVEGLATASGTLTASDVDTGATKTWSIADAIPESTYGNIEINTITGVWTYTLDNSKAATQALQEGEVVTQSYIARVTDEFGAYADQPITVSIHGTNEAPANSIPTVSGPLATTVAEGDPSVSLNLLANAHDADLTDTLRVGSVSYTVNGEPSALPSGITLNGNTLTVDPGDPAFDAMGQGEHKTIVAIYQVLDSSAAAEPFFESKVDYTAGNRPISSVTSADVNGDGKSDLIVACPNADWDSDTVSVLMNNGDGSFAAKVDYATVDSASEITSADVNGDGKSDLIVVHHSSVSVLVNNGDGIFDTIVNYAAGSQLDSVTSTDVNGDGQSDLIIAYAEESIVSVLMNNGDGTFATKVDYATGERPHSLTSADVSGDGKSDLIVTNWDSDTVSVLKNNGDGTFAPKVDYVTGPEPRSITCADVNGDGKSDLIVDYGNSDTVSVLINNSTGFISDYPTTTATITINGTNDNIPTVSGPLATTVAEGDPSVSLNLLTNAHDADLNDTLRIGTVRYAVNGVQSAMPSGITLNGNTLTVDPGDPAFDAMGQGEQKTIVAIYQVLDGSAALETSFATKVDYSTGYDSSVTSADVNGDGKLDLITAGSDGVSVLMNNGNGTFADEVGYATGSWQNSVTSADVNVFWFSVNWRIQPFELEYKNGGIQHEKTKKKLHPTRKGLHSQTASGRPDTSLGSLRSIRHAAHCLLPMAEGVLRERSVCFRQAANHPEQG